MRALIQKVETARVIIDRKPHSAIGRGLLVLLGIEEADNREDIEWLAGKISRLRVFDDSEGVMNLPVTEVGGEIMVVSQFTLHASIKKGNRPSYIRAARPQTAIPLYEAFIDAIGRHSGCPVCSGKFGAVMKISLVNDGPVTLLIDSRNRE